MVGLVGHKVAVNLNNVEARGVEIIGTPDQAREDGSGRVLPWSPQGAGASDREADGEVEVRDLPKAGELEVEVTRLVALAFDEEAGDEVVEGSFDGPWVFRFVI